MGLMHGLLVLPANVQDRDGAKQLRTPMIGHMPRLARLWADGGYAGWLVDWVRAEAGWKMEIVAKPPKSTTFKVLPKRWIVERTFAWIGKSRRLSKDDEHTIASSEALIQLAMIGLMLRRLKPAP
jgi:putative transposase